MELDCLLTLIDKVSSSEIGSFEMEDGNFKLSMKKNKKELVTVSGNATEISQAFVPVQQTEKEETVPEGNQVKAPLVGTFYHAPAPDAEPFVRVGDTVQKGQILGIIEAMKLMNEIESEFDGVIEEILVSNEQLVEYGQPMFVIR